MTFPPGFWALLCTDALSRTRKQRDYGRFQFCCTMKYLDIVDFEGFNVVVII